jgi:hypothetical protein
VSFLSQTLSPHISYSSWFTRYASLASTILFLFHTILFFWNRYELPALHAGLITPQSPRARVGPVERGGRNSNYNNNSVGGTETTATSTFLPQPYPLNQTLGSPMRSAVAAASTSLQSIRSLASMQSLTSLAERTVSHSPNLIFHGGYNLNDSIHTNEEDDSYTARVGEFNSFHHHNSWRGDIIGHSHSADEVCRSWYRLVFFTGYDFDAIMGLTKQQPAITESSILSRRGVELPYMSPQV